MNLKLHTQFAVTVRLVLMMLVSALGSSAQPAGGAEVDQPAAEAANPVAEAGQPAAQTGQAAAETGQAAAETDNAVAEAGAPEVGESEVDEEESELSAEEREIAMAAVAKPVSGDPIQVFGWREKVHVNNMPETIMAKLDTGARTSSIHAEKKEMFERDGKKWMRFVLTDPTKEQSFQVRVEAPLVRIVRIKEPGGKSTPREVVKLGIKIGERNLRGEFTLNNRSNMLAPVLIGRTLLQEIGLVDASRVYLAEKNIFR